jgi:hypothetical protein
MQFASTTVTVTATKCSCRVYARVGSHTEQQPMSLKPIMKKTVMMATVATMAMVRVINGDGHRRAKLE